MAILDRTFSYQNEIFDKGQWLLFRGAINSGKFKG